MAHNNTRGRTIRRTTAGVAATVALLSGVAVAFFITSEDFAGRNATTGVLDIEAGLSVDKDWSSNADLFPRSEATGFGETVTFGNTQNPQAETIAYTLAASEFTCTQADLDPAPATTDHGPKLDTTPADTCSYTVGAETFNLQDEVQVTVSVPGTPGNGLGPLGEEGTPTSVYYTGPLSCMSPGSATANPELCGDVDPFTEILVDNGNEDDVQIEVWLLNTDDHPQPQGTTIDWVFTASATTPV